jgi:hypothetical protein
MSICKLTTSAFAMSVVLASALTQANAAPPKKEHEAAVCVFDRFAPTIAAPYKAENAIDFGSYSSLGGAQLFVPAREGLTREWLTASVQQAMNRAQTESSSATDPAACDSPSVKNVSVRVVSGNTGYWVQLISPDRHSSEALLQWARSLADQHRAPIQAR